MHSINVFLVVICCLLFNLGVYCDDPLPLFRIPTNQRGLDTVDYFAIKRSEHGCSPSDSVAKIYQVIQDSKTGYYYYIAEGFAAVGLGAMNDFSSGNFKVFLRTVACGGNPAIMSDSLMIEKAALDEDRKLLYVVVRNTIDTNPTFMVLRVNVTTPNIVASMTITKIASDPQIVDSEGNPPHYLYQVGGAYFDHANKMLWVVFENLILFANTAPTIPQIQIQSFSVVLHAMAVDEPNGMVYIGADISVLRIPITNTPFGVDGYDPGLTATLLLAGDVYSIAVHPQKKIVIAGTLVSVGYKIDVPTFSISGLFLWSAPAQITTNLGVVTVGAGPFILSTLILDDDAAYFATGPFNGYSNADAAVGFVLKVHFNDFSKVFAVGQTKDASLPIYHFGVFFKNTQDHIYMSTHAQYEENYPNVNVPAIGGNANKYFAQFMQIKKRQCELFLCTDCHKVPGCGFCYNTGVCSQQDACPVQSPWETSPNYLCPDLFSVSPTAAPASVGATLTLKGTSFPPTINCFIDGTLYPATIVPDASNSNTTITCTAPPVTLGVNEPTRTVKVGAVVPPNISWGLKKDLVYFNCSKLSCSTCFNPLYSTSNGIAATEACGFCPSTLGCASSSSCATTLQPSCPKIQSVSPQRGVIQGENSASSIKYDVTLSYIDPAKQYVCQIAGNDVPATVDGTTLHCEYLPAYTMAGSAATELAPITIAQLVNSNPVAYASGGSIEYYDCSRFTTCAECLDDVKYPRCDWCKEDAFCQVDSAAVCPVGEALTCANITSIVPASLGPGPTYPQITVTLVGHNFDAISNFMCVWNRLPPAPAATQQLAATYVNSTAVTCSTPATPTTSEWNVYLQGGANNKKQLEPYPFLFYECNGATDCFSCTDQLLRPQCKWCSGASEDLMCGDLSDNFFCFLAGDTPILTQSGCTVIQYTQPQFDAWDANSQIYISLNTQHTEGAYTYLCRWSFGGNTITTTAFADGPTGLRCNTKNPNTIKEDTTAQLTILKNIESVGIKQLTQPFPFTFKVCEVKSCSQCIAEQISTNCRWCGDRCAANSVCEAQNKLTACPVLQSVSPQFALIEGDDTLTITANSFLRPKVGADVKYECDFGGKITEGVLVSGFTNKISCQTPKFALGNTTLQVRWKDAPYAPEKLPFEFFDCVPFFGGDCNSACMASHCGWCLEEQTCTSQVRCPSLWIQQCIIAKPEPNHATLAGGEEILVALPPGYEALNSSDLTCVFGTQKVSPTVVQIGNQTYVKCITLRQFDEDKIDFQILYKEKPFTPKSDFFYVDCTKITICEEQRAKTYCGWCLDTNKPVIQRFCPGTWTDSDCPDLINVEPSTANLSGGVTATIFGEFIINNPNIQLKFENYTIPDIVIANNTIVAEIPAVTALGFPNENKAIKIRVLFNETRYALKFLTFNYILQLPPTEPLPPGTFIQPFDAVPVGVGVGAGALVVVALSIGAVVYYRKKIATGIVVRVKEPDYVLVAYGSDLNPLFKSPEGGDGYKKLDTCLARQDFAVQRAIETVVDPTQQDNLAKSLIYIAHDQGKSVSLINRIVRGEINRCLEENTIFRGNSMASKMFKFYSRMVGIKYLWKTMARVIAELEVLGQQQVKRQTMAKEGRGTADEVSLFNIDVELDQDKALEEGLGEIDADANLLQLTLVCQKVFGAILKNATKEVPTEFRQIFVNIDNNVMSKFGSNDASYKAIGGFFFLRFLVPSLTAPHFYGLIESPPNEVTQRQLVLISKVIQSLANMVLPGKKEGYMESLSQFIESGIPKVIKFYEELRKSANVQSGPASDMTVPPVVKENALAVVWGFIKQNNAKLAKEFDTYEEPTKSEIQGEINELLKDYDFVPKKLDAKKPGEKGKKKKKAT